MTKLDYFAFIGPSDFELTLWDARAESPTFGAKSKHIFGASNPCAVTIPPGVVHAYTNIGDQPGWVFNGPNRLYAGHEKNDPVDEIRHELDPKSPYKVDSCSIAPVLVGHFLGVCHAECS